MSLPPFPPLSWDGLHWRGSFQVPWYPTESPVEVVVRPDYSRPAATAEVEAAPRPTGSQAAAFQLLLDPETPLQASLLGEFRKYVPELADAEWEAVPAFWGLAQVLIFHPALEGVSYAGFVFNCLDWNYGYEHGAGVVAHRDRVVHFGMAEEADEARALKDLRRLTRAASRRDR